LSSLHLFKNWPMFNQICEFSNNFLHKSPIYYNILVHKSWKLHQNFQIFFSNFWYLFNIKYFFKLYKDDATTTPIALYRIFVIVNKVLCPQLHQKSSHDIQNQHFLHFSILFIFSHMYFFFYNFDEDRFSMVLINI
jgi:hypothetical protein